ncbi:hypothetical protein [Shewanella colwelliana]|uniref:hypothetical protein n=1 Tax=Shewanella colwelliana TaxID=23 RepID=UPI003735ED52
MVPAVSSGQKNKQQVEDSAKEAIETYAKNTGENRNANGASKPLEITITQGCNQTGTCDGVENPATRINLGTAVGGVAAGMLSVNNADILKPKQNVTQHRSPTLNKPRIGVAKNADDVLINITDVSKTASRVLIVGGVAIAATEALIDMRNPLLSQEQKVGSGVKASTDIAVIGASTLIGGPLGIGLAAGYLAADYYFDFKSHIQESIKYYRREEEK